MCGLEFIGLSNMYVLVQCVLKFLPEFVFFFFASPAIGRNLIPRYFRSIFEGGVKELYYHIVQPKESFHNSTSTITLDCENTTMVTHHKSPVLTKVCQGSFDYLLTSSIIMSMTTLDHLFRNVTRCTGHETISSSDGLFWRSAFVKSWILSAVHSIQLLNYSRNTMVRELRSIYEELELNWSFLL